MYASIYINLLIKDTFVKFLQAQVHTHVYTDTSTQNTHVYTYLKSSIYVHMYVVQLNAILLLY